MAMRVLNWAQALAVGVVGCASGCADGTATATDAATTATSDTGTADATLNACPVAPTVLGSTPIAINEVQGKGDDWVELVNTGAQTVSLGGMVLADVAANGCPKTEEALTFPTSAQLAPGARMLVVGKKDPKIGEQTDCLTGSTTPCWHMAFKVSASTGDAIFLISGAKVVAAAAVPPNTLSGTASWGRLPDGTGVYTNLVPTPGAANKK